MPFKHDSGVSNGFTPDFFMIFNIFYQESVFLLQLTAAV
jgi:hypothetical protein